MNFLYQPRMGGFDVNGPPLPFFAAFWKNVGNVYAPKVTSPSKKRKVSQRICKNMNKRQRNPKN